MAVSKGYKQLLAEANAKIRTLTPQEADAKRADPNVLIVDLRDPRELEREGMVPGAFHATRGMLEFWVDPESPYYKPVFGERKELVLYCGGGWRSALSAVTLQEMGYDGPIAHIEGGFGGWKDAGLPIAERKPKAT
jgi:rhodanese-related sulfurtransferase